ncbi:MAG: threonine synthase [Bacteroidales bacterium]|nr:threonine synthase [Bacteroidales bacterium]
MLYLSTNRKSDPVSFSEALLRGQAPDRGLYMPVTIPEFSRATMASFVNLSYDEIAFRVATLYMEDELPAQELRRITRESYDFNIPLERVTDRKYIMRLDQGPTASFKDFAARMMGRLMQYYLDQSNGRLLILTATSGDTGSAVANAFYGLDNIQVVVLFPRSEVTERQRRQMTTLGKNVHILALDAKFDDCQALVKKAFADQELGHLKLSSANSINIGRLIPQIVYYFYAWSRLARTDVHENIIFSVPSGNFGDMMGGVLALKMGLPVKKFVIATNENDEFPMYLNSGIYRKIEPSRNCISSAMNVGHPSNLARLVSLYGGLMDEQGKITVEADMVAMRKDMFSVSIDDTKTRETIQKSYRENGVLLEPHGAVGWAGLHEYLDHVRGISKDQLCVSIETAHPAKFPGEIQKLLELEPAVPPSLEGLDHKPEFYSNLGLDYREFKAYLLEQFG